MLALYRIAMFNLYDIYCSFVFTKEYVDWIAGYEDNLVKRMITVPTTTVILSGSRALDGPPSS